MKINKIKAEPPSVKSPQKALPKASLRENTEGVLFVHSTGSYKPKTSPISPRLGRFSSRDRYFSKYPAISPYAYCLNNPIFFIDPSGDTVTIHITATKVGTTKINLFSSTEIKDNAKLKDKTKEVNVYEVTISNESGSTATFYYTRIAYRGNTEKPDDEDPAEVTFDVLNDGDEFLGVIKDRWGGTENVIELRAFDDETNQTVKGKKANTEKNRTAIQLHVKGASDGCLLCVGKDQFESKEEGITIDETNLESASKGSQENFMKKVKDLRDEDSKANKSDKIKFKFNQLYQNETKDDDK